MAFEVFFFYQGTIKIYLDINNNEIINKEITL